MKEKKTKFLIFRVSKEERKIIETQANEGGFKRISDYLRSKLGL
jgi:hypothetical protein